ncbi:renin receptor-like [Haliotis cracherodii]|uniref:renin receptor-like n=1 Tax=Haliotis cracherodii TaxID=6455 RepID=UPI0039E9DA50
MATLKLWRTSVMTRFSVLVFCAVLSVSLAGQELVITHAPSYVTFQQQADQLHTSQVPKVLAHTLGLKTESDLGWKGLVQGSMFKRPKANVLMTIVTHPDQPLPLKKLAKFPVDDDVAFPDVEGVMNSLQGTFLDQSPLMLDLHADNNMFDLKTEEQLFRKLPNSIRKLSDRLLDADSIIHKLSSGSLNMTLKSDLSLMSEMQMIADVMKTMTENPSMVKNKTPDLFSFTIYGLRNVADKHGLKSEQTKDATKMVSDFVDHVTDHFKSLYKDNVVVEVLSAAPQKGHVRKVRSLMATTPAPSKPKSNSMNLADDYSQEYPAIFNIILWMMVVLAIAVYAIVYGMWYMDPGVDSIIYRMTSQRLKKD